ncbi:MAG: hypothetical protein B6I28_04515 [Fusobacteriia bacterium 4572_132]|nr:MAG: hypothetical protein B6I28_04515 [Fusobacteriia bacterium 4572_132]
MYKNNMDSKEGKRSILRIKPPYPAQKELNRLPKIVNNIESLVNIPLIIRGGGEVYSRLEVLNSAGTKLVSICGLGQIFGELVNSIIENFGEEVRGN